MTDKLDGAQASPSPGPKGQAIIQGPGKSPKQAIATASSLTRNSSEAVPGCNAEGDGAQSGKARSVKAIVAWLESSADKNATPQPQLPESSSSKTSLSPSAKLSAAPPQLPKMNFQNPPDVEEYSLTLLKYRQYFTEQPLGRCLDGESCDDTHGEKTRDEDGRGKGGSLDQVEDKHEENKGGDSHENAHTPHRRNTNSITIARTEKTESPPTYTNNGKMPSIPAAAPGQTTTVGFNQRDPAEAAAFWTNVRAALWISDEELDQYSAQQQAERDAIAHRHTHHHCSSKPLLSPRLVKPAPSKIPKSNAHASQYAGRASGAPRKGSCCQRSRGVPWRRRNGSGPPREKTIDEIDEFLNDKRLMTAESLPDMSTRYSEDGPAPIPVRPCGITHSKSGSLPTSMPSHHVQSDATGMGYQPQGDQHARMPPYIEDGQDSITGQSRGRKQGACETIITYPDGQLANWI